MKRCDTCKFFETSGGVAHCRRRPPTAFDAISSGFPILALDWWCYDYKRSLLRTLKRWLPTASVK